VVIRLVVSVLVTEIDEVSAIDRRFFFQGGNKMTKVSDRSIGTRDQPPDGVHAK
jgi:hypothetical protein